MKSLAILIFTAVFCQIAVEVASYRRSYEENKDYIDPSSGYQYYPVSKPASRPHYGYNQWDYQGGSSYNRDRTTKPPRPSYNTYGGYGQNSYGQNGYGSYGYNPWNSSPSATTEKVVSKEELAAMCVRSCPVTGEYNPVCGSNDVTYSNLGRLECEQRCGVDVTLSRPTSCLVSVIVPTTEKTKTREEIVTCIRKCPVTDDFNPVCGSNNNTYVNSVQLECEKKCGIDVEMVKMSPCTVLEEAPAEGPTKEEQITDCIKNCPIEGEYKPVCGSNKQTYMNAERLQCAQNCGVDVQISRLTSCDDPLEVIPVLTTTERPFTNEGVPSYGGNYGIYDSNNNKEDIPNENDKTDVSPGNVPGVDTDNASESNKDGGTETQSAGGDDIYGNNSNGVINGNVENTQSNVGTGHPTRTPSVKEVLECSQSCILSSEANPICGTDDITYANPGRLLCAQFCGVDVQVKKFGSCKSGTTDNMHCVTTCSNSQFTGNSQTKYPDYTGTVIPSYTGNPSSAGNPGSSSNVDKPESTGNPGIIQPLSRKDCMDGCPTSNVYRPVCGTDYITYRNIEMLQCAAHCGVSVTLLVEAECSAPALKPSSPVLPSVSSTSKKPIPLTGLDSVTNCISRCARDPTYDPICGTNKVTYNNTGHLICARECGVDVRTHQLSACEDNFAPEPPTPNEAMNQNIQNQNYVIAPEIIKEIWGKETTSQSDDDDEQYQLDQRIKDSK